jgi:Ras-related protein Rab-6A
VDVHLTLWDTAGSEKYRSLMHSYLRDSEIAILVYDTSKRESNLVHWMRIIEQYNPTVVGVLGNKTDLTTEFTDDLDEILFPWFRINMNIVLGTCSSRKKDEVKYFLKKCIRELIAKKKSPEKRPNAELGMDFQQKNKCCT